MKTKISIFLFIIFCVLNHTYSYAQLNELRNTKPEQRAIIISDWMKRNLYISHKQSKTLEEVNLKYAKKIQIIVENKSLNSFEIFNQAREIDKEKDKELKNILTKEQFEFYIGNKDKLQRYMVEQLNQSK